MANRIFGMITTSASSEYTPHALRTFAATTKLEKNDECILIDNDATYDSSESFGIPITKIQNAAPLGFAENMNVILKRAHTQKADAVLLNNDLIFSDGWISDAASQSTTISSPLSSREMQYQAGPLHCTNPMTLDQYLGNEHLFPEVVSQHRARMLGESSVLALPFFAVTIPWKIIDTVGLLDESFGKGGGEDYDYSLRAILAGFTVHYLLKDYIIHFGGRSSWAGHESEAEQRARNAIFFSRFAEKWGEHLTDIILRENHNVILEDSSLAALAERGSLKTLIESLLQKEGKIAPVIAIPATSH